MKHEKFKKLEMELHDLEQWLILGLVPKKDIEKHKIEIATLKKRISEEKSRLQALRESDDTEGSITPKRNSQLRQGYPESAHTMSGVEMDGGSGMTDVGLEVESETYFDTEATTTVSDDESQGETTTVVEEEDDPFSDKNRWRRGILEDPDNDSW